MNEREGVIGWGEKVEAVRDRDHEPGRERQANVECVRVRKREERAIGCVRMREGENERVSERGNTSETERETTSERERVRKTERERITERQRVRETASDLCERDDKST
tara:strand:- start:28 stop:351 length:324 start_codon:yes stop_codon:yes gene_type:complete